MNEFELSAKFADAEPNAQRAMLETLSLSETVQLARALKDQALAAWASEPSHSVRAANGLAVMAAETNQAEIGALAAWAIGIAALTRGQMQEAIEQLDRAEAGFAELGMTHPGASTQVSKLIALAMLGHYDEALTCGARARDVFVAQGDQIAAAKIEQNLANTEFRRGRYAQAEALYRAAGTRLQAAGDVPLLNIAENGLANVLTQRHEFGQALNLFERALERAQDNGLVVQQAMLECNIGSLALFQGLYDRALEFLERSRRRYAELEMPHESSIAEMEMADAYLELNLAREAAELYATALVTFTDLRMQAERAHCLMQMGRAAHLQGKIKDAIELLADAGQVYAGEENPVGAARVAMAQALCALDIGDATEAERYALAAVPALEEHGARGAVLTVRWLQGEALRLQGHSSDARKLLYETLEATQREHAPQIAQRCHTSLGLLAAKEDAPAEAEAEFRRAIDLIQALRAPLPADSFRTAFVADKLTAYTELVRLCLADGTPQRTAEALEYVERARARALVEMLGNAVKPRLDPLHPDQAHLLQRIEALRAELNWFYNQMNQPADGESARTADQLELLEQRMRVRETELEQTMRQLEIRSSEGSLPWQSEPFSLDTLQQELGEDRALVEFFTLDGEFAAFVVTRHSVRVVMRLATEEQVEQVLEQFQFQINALRYGAARLRERLPQLAERAKHHLARLYDLLLAPLEALIGEMGLVLVPHRQLHYVPFHALYDGTAFVIERREVSYAPSAAILNLLLRRPRRAPQHAVLVGLPDEGTPHVRAEIAAIQPWFSDVTILTDEDATWEQLRAALPLADVVHIASHAKFRHDNPLFSALRLHGGWMTVRDAYALELDCELVTLSACETGVSAIAPGDELIGLARGFLRAGAPSLAVSLWTVDDEATARLMGEFYAELTQGDSPAAALRKAQQSMVRAQEHPYFWAAFVLMGRW